jgi:hypothetical protein
MMTSFCDHQVRRTARGGPVRSAFAALAILTALTAGCSSAPAHPASAIMLPDCAGTLQAHPDVMVLACASTGITARSLRWSRWGSPVATATGTAVVDTCLYQDCAYGLYRSYPIVVVVSHATACNHTRAYTEIQYLFVGTSPFPSSIKATINPHLTRSCA